MKRKWYFIVPAALAGIALVIAIGGGLVYLLWNALLPALFGWPEVTFWQAFGLLALCRILFGGLGRHGRGPWGFRRGMDGRCGPLSDEERDLLRERLRRRWGFGPGPEIPPGGDAAAS